MSSKAPCKRCSEKLANCAGGLCGGCFTEVNGMSPKQARREKVKAKEWPVSDQLRAIRQALRWTKPDPPKNPLVRLYVKLCETNPREVAQQLERLEKEHRLAMKAAAPSGPAAAASETKPAPSPSGADYETGDGYDPRTDTATAQVIAMIDRWLAGHQARAMGKVEPPLVEDADDLEIPG